MKRFAKSLGQCFSSPEAKREYNEQLFTVVAPVYDRICPVLSFGRDQAWKRCLRDRLPELDQPVCVDLACGTGDLCGLLAQRYADADITGIDLTPAMLDIARRRFDQENISFRRGDMAALELDDASVDVVTGGYALRNAPEPAAAVREVARVLKPGGTAAFLDFSKPPNALAAAVEYAMLKCWGSFWGLCLHRSPQVYGYIAESLRRFPDRRQLRAHLAEAGLDIADSKRFYGGVLELTLCRRRQTDAG